MIYKKNRLSEPIILICMAPEIYTFQLTPIHKTQLYKDIPICKYAIPPKSYYPSPHFYLKMTQIPLPAAKKWRRTYSEEGGTKGKEGPDLEDTNIDNLVWVVQFR